MGTVYFSVMDSGGDAPLIPPILDTCVIADMFSASRPRHQTAKRLAELLTKRHVAIRLPMHAMFELAHAMKNMRGPWPQDVVNEKNPLKIDFVPIDRIFLEKYYADDLPDLRSGDLIFFAMAKKERLPLVTEDDRLFSMCQSAGVRVYRTLGYLEALGC